MTFRRVCLLGRLRSPNDMQRRVLQEADLHLTLLDLPQAAYRGHDELLIDMVREEVASSPLLAKTNMAMFLRAFAVVSSAPVFGDMVEGRLNWVHLTAFAFALFCVWYVPRLARSYPALKAW